MPQINDRNRLPWSALRCHRDRLSTAILAPFLPVVFLDGLPGLGGSRGLHGAPGDRWRRALPPRDREAEQEAAEDPARRGPAGPGLRGARRHRGGQGRPALPAPAPDGLGLRGGTWTARPPGGWSRNIARRPGSTRRGWAAAASAFTRCARRRSTTPSATGPRCTRCGSSPATPTSARPRSTSFARRKTLRWRRGASRFASRDARERESAALPFAADRTPRPIVPAVSAAPHPR